MLEILPSPDVPSSASVALSSVTETATLDHSTTWRQHTESKIRSTTEGNTPGAGDTSDTSMRYIKRAGGVARPEPREVTDVWWLTGEKGRNVWDNQMACVEPTVEDMRKMRNLTPYRSTSVHPPTTPSATVSWKVANCLPRVCREYIKNVGEISSLQYSLAHRYFILCLHGGVITIVY